MKKLIIIIIAFIPFSAYGWGPNVVLNGDMETGTPPTSWTDSSATNERDASPYGGTYCLKSTLTANWGGAYQDVVTETGKLYRVIIWYKATSGDTIDSYINNGGGERLVSFSGSATSWEKLENTFTALSTSTRVYLGAQALGDIVWFDDVSIKLNDIPIFFLEDE